MPKKRPHHVPEWHDVKPNREQRRHPGVQPQDHPLARDADAPPPATTDVPDVRAKNSRHGKLTADKWNQ